MVVYENYLKVHLEFFAPSITKKILLDNHYETIYGLVRTGYSQDV